MAKMQIARVSAGFTACYVCFPVGYKGVHDPRFEYHSFARIGYWLNWVGVDKRAVTNHDCKSNKCAVCNSELQTKNSVEVEAFIASVKASGFDFIDPPHKF